MTNFVLVIADDMRYDHRGGMSNVMGSSFVNAYNSNPVCIPSRTSILSGLRSQHTRIYGNDMGFAEFDDSSTIAARLQAEGYTCGHFGKYVNDYNDENAAYTPPGWDRWWAITAEGDEYYNYSVSDNGVLRTYGSNPEDYLTDVIARRTEDFIADAPEPFFAYVTPTAPHEKAVVADRHVGALQNLPYDPPSLNVSGVDQPEWIRRLKPLDDETMQGLKEFRLKQRTSLLAVDDLLRTVRRALQSRDVLRDTVIIFMSDNGMMYGEHKLTGKAVPYLESTHMPLYVWGSEFWNWTPNKSALVQTIDVLPTFLDLADVHPDDRGGVDGLSLRSVLTGGPSRKDIYIEHGSKGQVPPWVQVTEKAWTYAWYGNGTEELYKISADPYQLTNLANDKDNRGRKNAMRERAKEYMAQGEPPTGMELLP